MAVSAHFTALIKDLLAPLEPIAIRRMFSGAGVFRDGQMFALIVGESLYFKVDEAGRAAFIAEGMGPFTYNTKAGTNTIQSYWRAPDRLLDDAEEFVAWSRRALAVAERSRQARPRPDGDRARPRPRWSAQRGAPGPRGRRQAG